MQKPNRHAVLINGGILFGAAALIMASVQPAATVQPGPGSDLAAARTTPSAGRSPASAPHTDRKPARSAPRPASSGTPLSNSASAPAPVVLPPVANSAPAKQNAATIILSAPAPARTSTTRITTTANGAAAPAPSGSSYAEHADIADAIYSMINSERAANGLAALGRSSQLNSSAHAHNVAMADTGQFAHQVTGEASLGPRITATGYHWIWAGENIAWGSYASVAFGESLESEMYNEPPNQPNHRANILSTSAHNVGVDVITDGSGKMWITCDFGS